MSISTEKDPLDTALNPERVFYAVGSLLGVEDFTAEQTYHRGRLARALSFLDGYGTLAGLKVDYQGPPGPGEEIIVRPGIALDRLGRMIEVPRDACIRLDRWFSAQPLSEIAQGLHPEVGGVMVDVFIRFVACDRTLTPAFASGPFDATDFVTPSRTREGYKLDLVMRKEAFTKDVSPALPKSPWPDLAAEADPVKRRSALHTAIFASFAAPSHQRDGFGNLLPLPEHAVGQDPSSVFLARFVVPAAAGTPPIRTVGPIVPNNDSRAFIYPAGAIARWIGV